MTVYFSVKNMLGVRSPSVSRQKLKDESTLFTFWKEDSFRICQWNLSLIHLFSRLLLLPTSCRKYIGKEGVLPNTNKAPNDGGQHPALGFSDRHSKINTRVLNF